MHPVQHVGESSGLPDFGCPRPSDLGPPPGAPIRTAWIAGRIGLAFVDEADSLGSAAGGFSLTSLEALDVSERPYIWDL